MFIFLINLLAEAQISNDRCQWVAVFNKPVKLDSLSIFPESLSLSSTSEEITYDYITGYITIHSNRPLDSILVCYKVLPYDFYHEYKNKSIELTDSVLPTANTNSQQQLIQDQKEELFSTDNIYKSGALSRGVSFGNRQDIFVNSVLNLQLDGKLSENLNIRASITDQNIPYQPEGNTKLVQDFDNVLFEIYNQNFSLQGGDIVLNNNKSEFLRFQRNVQGASLQTNYKLFNDSESNTSIAFSVSKGKFSSYQLDVIDGVMGPYKIYGPNHEAFLIIIANSETVYLDGRKLVRGFNNDYVIDYNTAEITFTNRVLITRFSRVNIDFEYTNQSYSRSVMNAAHFQKIKKLQVAVQFYQEKDNRNQPLSYHLTDKEKWMLMNIIPDKDQSATLPGWDSIGYNETRILYKKIDTVSLSGEEMVIFEISNNADSAIYEVTFSGVGWGKGDYVRKNMALNGQFFEWVGPGIGNYLPVKIVPLPDMKQMITIRSELEIDKNNSIFSEFALSNHQNNLYNKALEGQKGFAMKSGWLIKDKEVPFLSGYSFTGQIDVEYDHKDFNVIDRFRYVEYDRNWSYNPINDTIKSSDKIINFSGSLNKDGLNRFDVSVSRRIKEGIVDGWQGKAVGGIDFKHLNFSGDLFLMKNDNDYHSSKWIRYQINSYFKTKYFFPGYQYSVDNNTVTPSLSDSIVSTAMNFEEHLFFIRNNDTLKTRFNLNYSIRKDRIPVYGEMKDRNLSKTVNLMLGTSKGKLGKADLSLIYRQLAYLEDSINQDENSLLGRFDWFVQMLKGHVQSEVSYVIGNSRELKREYVFIQVPTGEGTHTWRDQNNDGVQDLSEFYVAINPDERNFIKLFTPTDDYVLAYDNNLNYRLTVDMPRAWRNYSGIKKLLGKFSNSLFINLKQKINQDNLWDNIFFKGKNIDTDQLLSYRENIRNTLHYNRSNPKYGIDFMYHQLNYKQLISNGFESRDQTLLKLISRLNIKGDYNFRLILSKTNLASESDFLEGRNFLIQGKTIKTTFEWQPSNFWRFSTDYAYLMNNDVSSNETNEGASKISESVFNIKYSKASNRNIDFTLRYMHINFIGQENTAVGYELLKGLKPGDNVTWSFLWQQKLFNGLQMNLSYEGRKSGNLDIIHVGRMQVMAFF